MNNIKRNVLRKLLTETSYLWEQNRNGGYDVIQPRIVSPDPVSKASTEANSQFVIEARANMRELLDQLDAAENLLFYFKPMLPMDVQANIDEYHDKYIQSKAFAQPGPGEPVKVSLKPSVAGKWDKPIPTSSAREELRKPQDLARSLRSVATELRGADAAVLREWDHPAFREGRCHLLEEAAAALESPSVLASVKRLLQILK